MAVRKAHEVEAFLARPEARYSVVLLYGPDRGLVSERATHLAKASGADLSDPFATIKLDAEDAASDPSRVADEAHTVSMFGGKRLIWISGQTQKALINALEPVLATPPEDALVLVEAGDLRPTAPLRKTLEASGTAMVLPCFQDDTKALAGMIASELKTHRLEIGDDARSLLLSLLGDDRLASRAEVQKLCLYCHDAGSISADDVEAIVGDAGELAVDTVVDAAATGQVDAMQHMMRRLLSKGATTVTLTIAVQRYFQQLQAMRARMESQNLSPGAIIGGTRPPLNFKRKGAATKALSLWSLARLERVLQRIDRMSLDVRANTQAGPALLSTALLAIALEAKSLDRR